jgi:glycosyltransferase involved in cell wall biosynthesis
MKLIKMKRKISLGILAYNEALVIPTTLESLFKQTLFTEPNPDWEIEIIVIPNGCKDDTAQVAETTLKNLFSPPLYPDIHWQVHKIEQPGKSNAWNLFVHQFSDPKSEYFFLMDADIQLLHPQTLNSMVEILEAKPEAWVAVDKPIKDIAIKTDKTLIEQLSVWASGLSGNKAVEGGASWICGQLYCARSSVLRSLRLPTTLPTNDAFLYTMIVTDGLKSPENPNHVILAPSASHIFEAYTDISRLFRHEKWLICGHAVNQLLYADLKAHQTEEPNIGALIQRRNQQNPLWLNQLIQQKIEEKNGWLIPRFILIRRFKSLVKKTIPKAILFFPLALTAFLIDLVLAIQVNQEMQENKGYSKALLYMV